MPPEPSAFAHLKRAARRLEAVPALVGVAELAAWLEEQDWRILTEGPGRVTAERMPDGPPHHWHILILHQDLPRQPWEAALYHRLPAPVGRPNSSPYHYHPLGKADGLVTVADVGLFIGGWLSHPPHGDAA